MGGYVRASLVALAFGALIVLAGCSDHSKTANRKIAEEEEKMLRLDQKQSGYVADGVQWSEFLECWFRTVQEKKGPEFVLEWSILSNYGGSSSRAGAQSNEAMEKEIAALEKRLGLRLPKSYKDFLVAFRPHVLESQGRRHPSDAPIGFFAPSQVGRYADMMPSAILMHEDNSIDSSDVEYFRYGRDQDDSSGRTRYYRNSILIGRFGPSPYDVILLHPDAKTIDGEMEAAALHHSGETRTPSFAEMMRQFSVLETRAIDGEGIPYPQEMLKNTCAEKLPLVNVWWK